MSKIQSGYSGASDGGQGRLTLWDLADPGTAAQAAIELYGTCAATAAAHCALRAHFDGREGDYRFWCTVFTELDSDRRH